MNHHDALFVVVAVVVVAVDVGGVAVAVVVDATDSVSSLVTTEN